MNEQLTRGRLTAAVLLTAAIAISAHSAADTDPRPEASMTPPSESNEQIASPSAAAPPQQPTAEQMRELMERHRAAAQPGPEHERLAGMQGTWDVELKMWPEPGAEAMTTTGTMEAETILGDRFLVQTIDLADTDPAGEQMSIIGFDRRSDEYIVMGMDTAGTYWVTARGPTDDGGKRAVLSGEDYDPIVDGTQLYDFVLSWPDDDTFVVEIVFKDDVHTRGGPPFKMVEVTSRRRQ